MLPRHSSARDDHLIVWRPGARHHYCSVDRGSVRPDGHVPEKGQKDRRNIGLMHYVPVVQFHDAYGVGRAPVIGDDALTDPEIVVPQDAAHRKVPFGRVACPLLLDRVPPAEPFPGLWIVQHRPG